MKSAVIDTTDLKDTLLTQLSHALYQVPAEYKTQDFDASLSEHLKSLWSCVLTAVCLLKLRGPCLQTADQIIQLQQTQDHLDLIIKTHNLIDRLTLAFIAFMFGRQQQLSLMCQELNDAIEMIESLDELPSRKHELCLLEQIAQMLFVKPLQALNPKQIPAQLASSLHAAFPNLALLQSQPEPVVMPMTCEQGVQTQKSHQPMMPQSSNVSASSYLVDAEPIMVIQHQQSQCSVQKQRQKLQLLRQQSSLSYNFKKKKNQLRTPQTVKVASGVLNDALRKRAMQSKETDTVSKQSIAQSINVHLTPDQLLFGNQR